jgi:hypothetical protein
MSGSTIVNDSLEGEEKEQTIEEKRAAAEKQKEEAAEKFQDARDKLEAIVKDIEAVQEETHLRRLEHSTLMESMDTEIEELERLVQEEENARGELLELGKPLRKSLMEAELEKTAISASMESDKVRLEVLANWLSLCCTDDLLFLLLLLFLTFLSAPIRRITTWHWRLCVHSKLLSCRP